VSAFGSVWAVCTDIQPINSATGTTSRPDAKSLSGLTASVGVQVGSYVWLAGQGKLNGHGKMKAVAVGVDATGTVRKRFTTRTARRREAAVSIAHGAGEVRAGDGLGRVYGLSPSTAKLRMTIRAGSPQGLAGRTSITVMSRPRAVIATGGSVWVFTDKYLYRYNPRSLGQTARHAAPSGTWIAAAVGPGGVARWPSSTRAGAAEVMPVSCPRGSCGAPRAPSRHPARAAAARR